jgi:hypothetical protein
MYVVPSGYCAISPNAITPSLRNPPEPLLFLHELPSVRVEGRGGRVLSRLVLQSVGARRVLARVGSGTAASQRPSTPSVPT